MSARPPRDHPRPGLRNVRSWPILELPRHALTAVLTVEATAGGLVLAAVASTPAPPRQAWSTLAVLVGLAVLHAELALGADRVRRRLVGGGAHAGLTSVWTFAGALLLPPPLAVLLAVAVQTHRWFRTGRPRAALYRNVYSTTTVVLACLAAGAVIEADPLQLDGHGPAVLVLALGVYTTVNSALIAGAIAMTAPQPDLAAILGDWDDNVLEIATLTLGALVAIAWVINPWLVLLVLPPLLVLHRAVLVRRLEEAANTDAKTGLLNAATWHVRAEEALRRTGRGLQAVLVLDLDHFKAVNDTHGHLVGDQVLAAVADTLRAEVRDRDLVGRFGGEEFVVFLAGIDRGTQSELEAVAERIRRRVAALRVEIPTADGPLTVAGLSVSVGGAVHTGGDGVDLTALMRVADTALYAAKRAGRNLVRMGVAQPVEPVETFSATLPVTGSSDTE